MSEIILGQELEIEHLGIRDALHVPVIVIKAHKDLEPGEAVGIRDDYTMDDNHIGVVDPFLDGFVMKDDPVAILLKPNSTMRVRHDWEHPGIEHTEEVINKVGPSDEIMEAVERIIEIRKKEKAGIPMAEPRDVKVVYSTEDEVIDDATGVKKERMPWHIYKKRVMDTLKCSELVINAAIEHMREYGTEVGGTQPGLQQRDVDKVDWVEFWERYNDEHGTKYGFKSDPFCCNDDCE